MQKNPIKHANQSGLLFNDIPSSITELNLIPKLQSSNKVENVPPSFYLSPNPHLGDFVSPSLPPKLVSTPYALNISAGKNTYVYDAHTYHTKVPPQGIELLIDYYTRPDDVVLDPFCGSGMTGVAATQIGRKAVLSDLSPAAAFIAYNISTPIPAPRYFEAIRQVLASAEELERKLYGTHCRTCERIVPMLYMVWSFGMLCKVCQHEFVLWDVARDERPSIRESKIKADFDCPKCGTYLKKRELKRTRRYPVQVGYKCCKGGLQESTASPDEYDLTQLRTIEEDLPKQDLWYPTNEFPEGMNTKQPIAAGITSVDKAYTPRALWAMSYLWDVASRWQDSEVRSKLLFTLTSLYQRVTVFSEFRFWGGSSNTANYNVPAIMNEQNVFKTFERKAKTISWYFDSASQEKRELRVSVQSACHLTQIPDKSVDYIFTDPPFGSNINYSEMNYLWESWLGIHTVTKEEAIVNKVQGKGVDEYRQLLQSAFSEMHRVLKDGGWLTIVFHNSSARVWGALQESINGAGFSIEGTQMFDKEHGTFKQFVSNNAVGYDLVLHCMKSVNGLRGENREVKDGREDTISFIKRAVRKFPRGYVVKYQHVTRDDEFDYRRLYAEWLAYALPKTPIRLSFEEFRVIADEVIKKS
ncbi:MAG TPA: DNA methyltransferase [Pyrinomonadaceae bacterium]